jgi:hypothetical protein
LEQVIPPQGTFRFHVSKDVIFSSNRTNALIQVNISLSKFDKQNLFGYGEVGLPPKKKYCYLADYEDILQFVTAFGEELSSLKEINITDEILHQPFTQFSSKYFPYCRFSTDTLTTEESPYYYFIKLLHQLDVTPLRQMVNS